MATIKRRLEILEQAIAVQDETAIRQWWAATDAITKLWFAALVDQERGGLGYVSDDDLDRLIFTSLNDDDLRRLIALRGDDLRRLLNEGATWEA